MDENVDLSWKIVYDIYNECKSIGKVLSLGAVRSWCLKNLKTKISIQELNSIQLRRQQHIQQTIEKQFE